MATEPEAINTDTLPQTDIEKHVIQGGAENNKGITSSTLKYTKEFMIIHTKNVKKLRCHSEGSERKSDKLLYLLNINEDNPFSSMTKRRSWLKKPSKEVRLKGFRYPWLSSTTTGLFLN